MHSHTTRISSTNPHPSTQRTWRPSSPSTGSACSQRTGRSTPFGSVHSFTRREAPCREGGRTQAQQRRSGSGGSSRNCRPRRGTCERQRAACCEIGRSRRRLRRWKRSGKSAWWSRRRRRVGCGTATGVTRRWRRERKTACGRRFTAAWKHSPHSTNRLSRWHCANRHPSSRATPCRRWWRSGEHGWSRRNRRPRTAPHVLPRLGRRASCWRSRRPF